MSTWMTVHPVSSAGALIASSLEFAVTPPAATLSGLRQWVASR